MILARIFIALWFVTALTLSATGWFRQFSSATLFGIGALASATGFTVLHWLSERFRGFSRARGLRRLTLAQTFRFFGILALIKTYQHVLPAIFAIPTGVLDVAIASTSLFVARFLISDKGVPLRGFIAWNVIGLGALGVSTIFAVLTSTPRFGLVEEGITSQPMTWFPMSIVPTFIGPFVLVCHLLAIDSARHILRNSPRGS